MKEKVRRAEIISEPDSDALVLASGGEKKITVQPVCLNNWQIGAVECGDEKRHLVSGKWQADKGRDADALSTQAASRFAWYKQPHPLALLGHSWSLSTCV